MSITLEKRMLTNMKAVLQNASPRQSILKLNDYHTHTSRGLHVYSYSYGGLHYTKENKFRLLRYLNRHELHLMNDYLMCSL